MNMHITDHGVDFIKAFEGLRLRAYKPKEWTEKYYTIGYGHYGPDVQKGQTITLKRAEELLRDDIKAFENYVNIKTKDIHLTSGQFDALVSFTYNVGTENFSRSTLLKKVLQDNNDKTIYDEFMRWVYAGGKKLKGLENRRKQEAELYFSL